MCGISVLWGPAVTESVARASLDALTIRGPDTQTYRLREGFHIGFARLHIQGPLPVSEPIPTGTEEEQPYTLKDGRTVLVNGEIFNATPEETHGFSDCVVVPRYLESGMAMDEVARQLDGDFAIVVVDTSTVTLCRDPYGVRPLYWGALPGSWCGVVSELKGFPTGSLAPTEVHVVEPGTTVTLSVDVAAALLSSTRWHAVPWLKVPAWASSVEGLQAGGEALANALTEAVAKRLTTVRAVGACLSGGLDSSLVAALAARALGGSTLHTFSIGMADSPDLLAARKVAAHIGSTHHERVITADECLAAIPAVVRAIETFDITTVRASVGNYLLGEFIARETPDVKVVLNGDGSDEALGGYLYMRAAPSDAAFEAETDRLLREIHLFDVARSERSMAAHGLESRSPFLDRQFIAVARALPTAALRPTDTMMEKSLLRTAFAGPLLPPEILWRRKEAFSDGISRPEDSWFSRARDPDSPSSTEAAWYRRLFRDSYPDAAADVVAPHMWMPRFVTGATDPSARTLTGLYGNSSERVGDE